ncbi:MAG: hypothetical protein Q9226_004333 [Calogaya cf. arnoldii]
MTAFTDLSLELREQIYKLSLLTSKTIYPYPAYYEEVQGAVAYRNWPAEEKIAAGLLGTNKQIRAEAAKFIFGNNVWHLSGVKELPVESQKEWPETVWTAHRDEFRHVKVIFHFGDLTLENRQYSFSYLFPRASEGWNEYDPTGERVKEVHRSALVDLQDIWCARMPFIASLHLDALTVDLFDCNCATCGYIMIEFVLNSERMFGNFGVSDEVERLEVRKQAEKSEWHGSRGDYLKGPPLEKPTHYERTKIHFTCDQLW